VPSAPVKVRAGETVRFSVIPDTNCSISDITGCNGSLDATKNSYMTGPISGDCTVVAKFSCQWLPESGQCGKAAGKPFAAPPTADLCTKGEPSEVQADNDEWLWTCQWPGGSEVQCRALRVPLEEPENGRCGDAAAKSFSAQPTTDLCAVGEASAVQTVEDGWTWICQGRHGGSDAQCRAIRGCDVMRGDLTGDGRVDIRDAILLIRRLTAE